MIHFTLLLEQDNDLNDYDDPYEFNDNDIDDPSYEYMDSDTDDVRKCFFFSYKLIIRNFNCNICFSIRNLVMIHQMNQSKREVQN